MGNSERWTPERAARWYAEQPWIVGANYIPSDAINQLEMFQPETWNAALNDRELGMAASIGMNAMRVFLHDLLWQDSTAFLRRVDEFLGIAAKHGIRVMPVLFDSCWDPLPKLGPQKAPTRGVHNSGWVQSPGKVKMADPACEQELETYVRGVVKAFRQDERVLCWDVWNEPDNVGSMMSGDLQDKPVHIERLLPKVFAWVRAEDPMQPLTSGVWTGGDWSRPETQPKTMQIQLACSDVISFHNYEWPESFESRIDQLHTFGRPVLCTEYMARGLGSTFDNDLPTAKARGVAAINWGLVGGKTQTFFPWDSWQHPYTDRPPLVWFHDIFERDGKPYRQREVDLLRKLTGRGGV